MTNNEEQAAEANRHGYVRAPELNGAHIGKGLWDFVGAEWLEIVGITHSAGGTEVETADEHDIHRWHLSTQQSFDVTAHPMRTNTTKGATP